mmetsp:Transcript_99535/g.320888  ORF Transcript_99535/g.320888 Transcript_99535/m.320888 type:complete len:234 (-) Transcript_99535:45-746(-)
MGHGRSSLVHGLLAWWHLRGPFQPCCDVCIVVQRQLRRGRPPQVSPVSGVGLHGGAGRRQYRRGARVPLRAAARRPLGRALGARHRAEDRLRLAIRGCRRVRIHAGRGPLRAVHHHRARPEVFQGTNHAELPLRVCHWHVRHRWRLRIGGHQRRQPEPGGVPGCQHGQLLYLWPPGGDACQQVSLLLVLADVGWCVGCSSLPGSPPPGVQGGPAVVVRAPAEGEYLAPAGEAE